MIVDARALRPSFVPQDLHHRDGQIEALANALKPVTTGDIGEDVFVFGPSGAGKTTTARYVLDRLERQALDVRTGYVNAMSDNTKAAALHTLLRNGNLGTDLRPEGTPSSTYINRLREYDGQFVAVIDEVDVLADQSMLHSLYDLPNVSMVLICVDEDSLFCDLDPRVESRLRSAEKLYLEKYTHDELHDILWSRVEAGLEGYRVKDTAVKRIADLAAGDARLGIALLRKGAKYVGEHGHKELSPTVVDAVETAAQQYLEERTETQLGTHQQLLFEIVRDSGEVSAGHLHETYEERAQETKAKSTRRKMLASLERYGLIEQQGTGRGTRYIYTASN